MTVAELIEELKTYPSEALVIQSSDSEGNRYSPTASIYLGRYDAETTYYGTMGLSELIEEDIKQGYSEEDVADGPLAICLLPTN